MENQKNEQIGKRNESEVDSSSNAKDLDKESYYKIVRPLRTYERDVAEAVRKQNASQASIHQGKKEKEQKEKKPEIKHRPLPVRKILVATLSVVLILSAGFLVIKLIPTTSTPVQEQPPGEIKSLIISEATRNINATNKSREGILENIEVLIQEAVEQNARGIVHFYFTEETLSGNRQLNSERFFNVMISGAPPVLIRALGPVVNFGVSRENQTPTFLIIEIDSFENAFFGMLSWEKTMAENLKPLIVPEESITERTFEDLIIRNRDARILRDRLGNTVILYSFINKNALLIARNEAVFREVLDKYQIRQASQR